MHSRKRVVLAKIEGGGYGVDPAPAAATDAVLVADATPNPMDTETVDRPLLRLSYGGFQKIPSRQYGGIDIDLEMVGFGSAGPATPTPGYSALLRACGLSQTVNAGVDVQYKTITNAIESTGVYSYIDGILHKFLGWRADLEMLWELNEIPLFRMTGQSIFAVPTDVALPSPTVSAYQVPVAVNQANTTALTIFGFATAKLKRMGVKLNNQLERRNLVGAATPSIELQGRAVAGSFEIEATTVAAKDWWTAIKNGDFGAISITHGPALKQVKVDLPNVQILNPKYTEDQGFLHMTGELNIPPTMAGNDEVTITVK